MYRLKVGFESMRRNQIAQLHVIPTPTLKLSTQSLGKQTERDLWYPRPGTDTKPLNRHTLVHAGAPNVPEQTRSTIRVRGSELAVGPRLHPLNTTPLKPCQALPLITKAMVFVGSYYKLYMEIIGSPQKG